MIKPIFSIFDTKTREYLHPAMALNQDVAIRDFYNTMGEIPNMRNHPADFSLHEIGGFNTETGKLITQNTMQLTISGLNCIESIQNKDQTDAQLQKTKVSNDSPIQPST